LHAWSPGLLAVINGDVQAPQPGRLSAVQDVPFLAAGGLVAMLDACCTLIL
jgi:hypothetical protein